MDQKLTEITINNGTSDLEINLVNLSEGDAIPWLLHRLCQVDSVNFVQEVIHRKPELVWWKNQDGQSAIHVACENGHVEIVKALAESTPDLCYQTDRRHFTPLHIATKRGYIQVIKTLLKACPDSLAQRTYHHETALHLATKHGQTGAFQVLMAETLRRKQQEKILHSKDYEGNDVLQVAVIHKRIQILEWLLGDNPKRCSLVRVNSTNGRGLTALDLHYQNFKGPNDGAISLLLHKAGAGRKEQSSSHSQSVLMHRNLYFSISLVLLISSILIASSTYASIFKINDTSAGIEAFRFGEIILHPDLLPNVFYSIMFMTVVFTVSMVGVGVLLWSMIKEWSFCFRALPLLGLGAFFSSYAFTMKEKVPSFWVTTDSFKISSFWLVWLSGQPLILILVISWLVAKRVRPLFYKSNEFIL